MNDYFIGKKYKKKLILVLGEYPVYKVVNGFKAGAVQEDWKIIKR